MCIVFVCTYQIFTPIIFLIHNQNEYSIRFFDVSNNNNCLVKVVFNQLFKTKIYKVLSFKKPTQ